MTTQPHFVVDKRGLAKLLDRKGKQFIVYELLANAWDEATKRVDVIITNNGPGLVTVSVMDDNPEGFLDLSHAYTLFAESVKKANPEQRGRFNLGEKLVIALAQDAQIVTTKGSIIFDKDGRRSGRTALAEGTKFVANFRMSREDMQEMIRLAKQIIPPKHIETKINGDLIWRGDPVAEIEASLPTEIADAEGYLRPTTRMTTLRLYDVAEGETPMLFEMGIPVVETSQRWHVDIGQKVPLNSDRDNVTPAYMRLVNVLVANEMYVYLRNNGEAAAEDWVTEALGHPAVNPGTVDAVLQARFGARRVVNDPSDPEGTKMAMAQGYTVIPSNAFSKEAWAHIRQGGHALPAGRVTPSPKAYSNDPDAQPLTLLDPADWTDDITSFATFVQIVGAAVLKKKVIVRIARNIDWPFAATFGPDGVLTVNLGRVGHAFFKGRGTVRQLSLLLHEFAHGNVSDHLSREFADEVARLGALLAKAVASRQVTIEDEDV